MTQHWIQCEQLEKLESCDALNTQRCVLLLRGTINQQQVVYYLVTTVSASTADTYILLKKQKNKTTTTKLYYSLDTGARHNYKSVKLTPKSPGCRWSSLQCAASLANVVFMLCSALMASDVGEVIRFITLDYSSSNHWGTSFTEVQCFVQTFACPEQAKCVFQWQLRDFNGKRWGWPRVLNLRGKKKVCLRYENVNLKKWFRSQPQGGYSYVWEPQF